MNKKPAFVALGVGAVLALVMIVAVITPKAAQVKSRQKDVQTAAQQEGTLRTQLEELQANAKDAPAERKRLKQLEAQIPPTPDLPGLIRTLNSTADKAGVAFMSIAPGQPSASGAFAVVPLQINITGGFFAIDQYLYLLETLPRVSKVTTISVAPGPNGLPELTVGLSASFFTTDLSAGPGTVPGGANPPVPVPTPTPTPSPSAGG